MVQFSAWALEFSVESPVVAAHLVGYYHTMVATVHLPNDFCKKVAAVADNTDPVVVFVFRVAHFCQTIVQANCCSLVAFYIVVVAFLGVPHKIDPTWAPLVAYHCTVEAADTDTADRVGFGEVLPGTMPCFQTRS